MRKIKVITLKQPWAELVILGAKKNEMRPWKLSDAMFKYLLENMDGELYIHASQRFEGSDLELCQTEPFFQKCIPYPHKLLVGAIIGKVKLRGFTSTNDHEAVNKLSKQERTFGWYAQDRWMWHLDKPERLAKPISCKGSLSIWDYDLEKAEVVHG